MWVNFKDHSNLTHISYTWQEWQLVIQMITGKRIRMLPKSTRESFNPNINIQMILQLARSLMNWLYIHFTTQVLFRQLQGMRKLITHCFFSFISHASSILSINRHLRKSCQKSSIYIYIYMISSSKMEHYLCILQLILKSARLLISHSGYILS